VRQGYANATAIPDTRSKAGIRKVKVKNNAACHPRG
jgi:hypothetical protein